MNAILPLIFAILGNKELMNALGPLLGGLGKTTAPAQQQSEVLFDLNWLQNSLNKIGHTVQITGQYDEQTKAAVKDFQEENNLVADGWAGVKTMAALFAVLAK